jgi:hypothetical protein
MPISSELLSAGVSFIITVLILSYLIDDNPLFRAALYVFVGVSAGYVAAVAWNQVIVPLLIRPIWSGTVFANTGQAIMLVVPLLGSALLLFKVSPRFARLGQLPVAYLVGVGAAVTIGGGVLGTLLPQVNATFDGFDVGLAVARGLNPAFMMVNGALILLGVIGTLAYFHFGASQKADGTVRRNIVVNILTWIGRVYIAITFGVLFAGVYMAALTALIERMDSIRRFIFLMMGSF